MNLVVGKLDTPEYRLFATGFITRLTIFRAVVILKRRHMIRRFERAGVCRDFAHLGIAFCRALSIPARFISAYAWQLDPADFHACFEAYLGDRWYLFDATRLAPTNGLVRIGTGKDAADTAFATVFGAIGLNQMNVYIKRLDESESESGDKAYATVIS